MTTRLWWLRPEDIPATPDMLALLNDEERAQQQRFIPPAKRQEYLATRVLVRSVLGAALGVPPQALRFVRNAWGRPALAPDLLTAPLHFNVSHTDGLVVCLISGDHQVGVDAELISRAPKLLELAPTVFAPRERADLAALPAALQAERAVTLWTLKESYIKARGMGLALPLDGFAFHFADGKIHLDVTPALGDDGACWQFHCQRLGEHYLATAMSVRADDCGAGRGAIELIEFTGANTSRTQLPAR